ncbi:RluA family pseudouridine synthase [Varunaivibrio sulfuroxidans]|uniref:Pseudouridine synthase n=1 Tax=Varunaivibrio sulfuroxidans TaxID=1773489 RepID=A0A4R3J801_9PROT|nr:RluA family pseudouridine synthase [Varunaivibrio sulfuroxidans]TCS62079.1 23S rRNA pseudouridine955/2504/2580 synthase [Varunaivibrio sulfuroxidans]WES30512.1 RluA family pseudouridine synthase [Varunaivibrio sulfuroxidans]
MAGVETITVDADDADVRLDRWLKRRFTGITQGRIQKLLRTGQIRVDGKRLKDAGFRLQAGQTVRVPPLSAGEKGVGPSVRPSTAREPHAEDVQALRDCVLYKDDKIIVLNKPAGLAVQGGTGTVLHVDAMLDGLRFGADRPRLTHRLDKDTSGVLVLARTQGEAARLTALFRERKVHKLYWAIVVGVPSPDQGMIDLALGKIPGKGGEKVVPEASRGRKAQSLYRIIDRAGRKAAWVAMEPLTGRTHQLRVHMAQGVGTPILGDGKYGGQGAFLEGLAGGRKLHLHARSIAFARSDGSPLRISAPLPEHMRATWRFLGFEEGHEGAEEGFGDMP